MRGGRLVCVVDRERWASHPFNSPRIDPVLTMASAVNSPGDSVRMSIVDDEISALALGLGLFSNLDPCMCGIRHRRRA